LTRCYVAGFNPECVILCRGVLENAITELFALNKREIPTGNDGRDASMRQKLETAEELGLITSAARKAASVVWLRGNTAVHKDVEATKDVLGTILLTVTVLSEIYGKTP
jgi:hypothetical protein